jgi:hypothetical protein
MIGMIMRKVKEDNGTEPIAFMYKERQNEMAIAPCGDLIENKDMMRVFIQGTARMMQADCLIFAMESWMVLREAKDFPDLKNIPLPSTQPDKMEMLCIQYEDHAKCETVVYEIIRGSGEQIIDLKKKEELCQAEFHGRLVNFMKKVKDELSDN